jgi:hypothetical protein
MSTHAPNAHLLKLNPYTPVFGELEINGNNFLAWRQDMRKLVKARGLQQTLPTAFRKDEGSPAIDLFEDDKEAGDPPTLEPTAATPSPAAAPPAPADPRKKVSLSIWDQEVNPADKATMSIILMAHMCQGLKDLYTHEEDPNVVWFKVNKKYANTIRAQKAKIRKTWDSLSVDAFPSLDSYECEMNKIVKEMQLCGYEYHVTDAEKIEKTIETLGAGQGPLQTTLRAHEYKVFDLLMHDLREQAVKTALSKARVVARAREEAETNMVSVRSSQGQKGPIHRTSKSSLKQKKAPMMKRGGPKEQKCFACGQKGHIARMCPASEESKNAYQKFWYVTRHQKSRGEAHGINVSYDSSGPSILVESNAVVGEVSKDGRAMEDVSMDVCEKIARDVKMNDTTMDEISKAVEDMDVDTLAYNYAMAALQQTAAGPPEDSV